MDKPIKASKLEDWDYRDETHSANERLRGDGEWTGPVPHRRITNLPCLVLFVLANCALGTSIYFVTQDSDFHRLFHAGDFRGEVCGYGGLSQMPYAYYPDSTNTALVICQQRCPQYFVRDYICYYDTDYETLLMDFGCWDSMESTRLGYYCIPGDRTDRENVWQHLMEPLEVLRRGAGDYIQAWDVVVGGVAVASGVGFLLLLFLQWRWTALWFLRLMLAGAVALVVFFAYLVYLTSIYVSTT